MSLEHIDQARGRPVDEINRFTRVVAAIIIPFLVAAFVILAFFPAQSGRRFAWEIQPAMTAFWMGAGYLGGAYFFLRVLLGGAWHRVTAGFLPVTAFTWAMLLATILHWQRFDLSHLPFQIWLVLYVVTPFLVPFVWWRNGAFGVATAEVGEVIVPLAVRAGMGVVGIFLLVFAIIAFVAPDVVISFWPWSLSPLTARVMGGWFALMGVGGVVMAREPRWSAWRVEVESIIFVWHALILIGAVVHFDDFKPGGAWFIAAEALTIGALALLYAAMERRRSSGTNPSPSV
jgi:hypothetical protein